MDNEAFSRAEEAIYNADVLIVGGTSLTVHPPSSLVDAFEGEHLIIINRTPTPYDGYAEFVIRYSIAAGEENEEEDDEPQPKEESTIESEALRVLREAMNLPSGIISISWVQRRFGYGYGKSAKLLDWLEDQRYVQSYADMKSEGLAGRRILISNEKFDNKI